jgi:hypothetical protein
MITDRRTQDQQVLNLIQQAGDKGVPNYELVKISLQYQGRIFSLRRKGYDIRKRRETVNGKPLETYYYYLYKEPAEQASVGHAMHVELER